MKQPTAPPQNGSIYPDLPVDDTSAPPDHSFRLHEISRMKKCLEDERDKRASLYKKYHRGVNALDGIDTALLTASTGMGIAGIGLLSTIIAALEIAALACGALETTGKFIGRRLAVKAKKHNQIMVLAEGKINTIANHVSTALIDGHISDDEFRLIVDEVGKYNQMTSEIRAGSRTTHEGITLDEKNKESSYSARKRRGAGEYSEKNISFSVRISCMCWDNPPPPTYPGYLTAN